jgi:hypothetical protein
MRVRPRPVLCSRCQDHCSPHMRAAESDSGVHHRVVSAGDAVGGTVRRAPRRCSPIQNQRNTNENAAIFVRVRIDNSTNNEPLAAPGGLGGLGGRGGQGGAPGVPGEQGSTTGSFSASSECPSSGVPPIWGRPGQPGSTGQAGPSGNAGSVRLEVTG